MSDGRAARHAAAAARPGRRRLRRVDGGRVLRPRAAARSCGHERASAAVGPATCARAPLALHREWRASE